MMDFYMLADGIEAKMKESREKKANPTKGFLRNR